ncbi:hypothetical protein [Aureimonas sp. Leaf324]|uniref:hypothetical protein n=1 Tax=Aureimonas sp. Leaf324 TaxID=1736336 RepID=UPI0006F772A2|nr:hypothetical protein [Aureimonas sp. Leaf324]KQQ79572.1 hypothetical protein ASF65_13565 [Aureimonas sp. Leaf324]
MIQVLRFLFLIPTGFVLACFAASFALLWPFIDIPASAGVDPFVWTELVFGFFAQAAQVGTLALVPWGLFMVLTEALGQRSLILHAAAGLVGGFAAARIPPGAGSAALETAMIVAGLAFGLVYWIVAGHGAGRWRRRPTALPPPQA